MEEDRMTNEQDAYKAMNRNAWDQRTALHIDSDFYDAAGFLAGKCTLNEIELSALGDVSGKSLLHLQCHFGLDTLSWARRGACTTGVDLSPKAIEQAAKLGRQAGLESDFICSDVYDFGESNARCFDIVFTSYGAICWLPDIQRWADVVASCLKPGGQFFMAEFHPVYDLVTGYSYFNQKAPDVVTEQTYSGNDAGDGQQIAVWNHALGEVVSALLAASLQIEAFVEYPYSPYDCFDNLQEREQGRFYLQHQGQDVPLVYSVQATKPL
jgi:2-polyprenyl-3-methyl-5-hydroxy-6-metoxy-1,4-benzoquinol methylase